jgi:tetratricopeptide (TPR) repeat protein
VLLAIALALAWTVDTESPSQPSVLLDATGKPVPPPQLSLSLHRAELALGNAEFPGALEAYEEVLAMAPEHWSARLGAGIAARKLRQFERARGHLEKAIAADAQTRREAMATAHFELGCVLAQTGERDRALSALERAIALTDGGSARQALLGSLMFDPDLDSLRGDERFDAMLRLLNEGRVPTVAAPVTEPVPPRALRLVSQAEKEIRENDLEGALMSMQYCLKLAPRFHGCYRVLGDAWDRLATRDSKAASVVKARMAYERYLELAPPDDEHIQEVRQILAQPP